jgi:hypothetical protein
MPVRSTVEQFYSVNEPACDIGPARRPSISRQNHGAHTAGTGHRWNNDAPRVLLPARTAGETVFAVLRLSRIRPITVVTKVGLNATLLRSSGIVCDLTSMRQKNSLLNCEKSPRFD